MGDVSEAKEVFTELKRQILERVDLSRDVSDEEMQELIDRDLNAALESGDAKLVDRALINSQRALADCQLKTAERVKAIAADHPVLVRDVKEIKVLVQKAKRKVWEVGLSALKWIIVGGGGVEFIRYLVTGHP